MPLEFYWIPAGPRRPRLHQKVDTLSVFGLGTPSHPGALHEPCALTETNGCRVAGDEGMRQAGITLSPM